MNNGTTSVTFLLVALIQDTQSRADAAVQHKLNANAAALMVETPVEDLTVHELLCAVGLEERVGAYRAGLQAKVRQCLPVRCPHRAPLGLGPSAARPQAPEMLVGSVRSSACGLEQISVDMCNSDPKLIK
ncbi:low affinity iron permease family protein [Nonomuraea dietziae]|uniref:low affinity iron permease family protein n=1 Tax=Nonomuraea dietziae TaxID=65515 RepID=UPI0034217539